MGSGQFERCTCTETKFQFSCQKIWQKCLNSSLFYMKFSGPRLRWILADMTSQRMNLASTRSEEMGREGRLPLPTFKQSCGVFPSNEYGCFMCGDVCKWCNSLHYFTLATTHTHTLSSTCCLLRTPICTKPVAVLPGVCQL